jgi:glycerophosphoryl diester phosphodiesterase
MIGFAHRGAPRTRAEENTVAAFERALALGVGGLESDVALSRDGIPVLHHPRLFRRRLRIADLTFADLPAHVPSLADLYERGGATFQLSLDMAAPDAAERVVATADRFGARDRLWLTYWRLPVLSEWRRRWPDLHLVYPTIPLAPGRMDRLLDRLAAQGVNVLNVHHRFCTPALAARVHASGLGVFAWGVHRRRQLVRLLRAQIDGVFCDDAEALAALTPG